MEITLVGIGFGKDDMTLSAYEAVKNCKKVFLRTALSVSGKAVLDRGIDAIPLDFVYEKSKNFDTLSKNLANEVLKASKTEPVVYLVDGNVAEDTSCSIIRSKCKNVKIIPGVSKAGYYLASLGISGGYQAVSAYDISNMDLTLPLVVYDIDSTFMASSVKLTVADKFGDEIPCYKFFNGKYTKIKLYELDFNCEFDYTSAIVIDKLSLTQKTRFTLDDLREIVKILRSENGCPWDRAQTKESIRQDIIEEAYELVDAINRDDEAGMCEESGDILLQAVFSTVFAEERQCFTLRDAISGICMKLIERHTHIFGADKATDAENALEIWDKNKQKEKGFETGGEYLEAVPTNLPALIRAQKVGSRAKKSNMDFSSALAVFEKIKEELLEVKTELDSGNKDKLLSEVGDLLFATVSLARLSGFSAEEALNLTTDKFIERFKKTEALIIKDGKDMKTLSDEEIDRYYNACKEN